MLRLSGQEVLDKRKRTGREKGNLGKVRKQQQQDLKGLDKIIGGDTYQHLNTYLERMQEMGGAVDPKVVAAMAKAGLSFKHTETTEEDHGMESKRSELRGKELSLIHISEPTRPY